jgi:hypothetical protein
LGALKLAHREATAALPLHPAFHFPLPLLTCCQSARARHLGSATAAAPPEVPYHPSAHTAHRPPVPCPPPFLPQPPPTCCQ